MSWANFLRFLLIAVALSSTAAGLIVFVARPSELTGLLAVGLGAVMGVIVVPRAHWPRAIVGVCTFAAILALMTFLRVLVGTYIEREMQPDAGLLWRLGISMLLFLPFVWWRKHRA
jgi:hypothetical protein